MNQDRAKQLANDHAEWLFALLRRVYEDALVHGYGHGWEDRERAETKEADDDTQTR